MNLINKLSSLDKIALRFVVFALLFFGLTANLQLVFFGHDGIRATRSALDSFIGKRARIMTLTEPESVIVVDRADKYLFPYRRVVVPLRDDKTYAGLPALVKNVPMYYFGITFPQTDIDYLNNDKLKALGLQIELTEHMPLRQSSGESNELDRGTWSSKDNLVVLRSVPSFH